jgi:hypothetical protein
MAAPPATRCSLSAKFRGTGSKWTAFNAIAEHLDYGRRYTARTNQVRRSFEDTALKKRALDLVPAA